MCSQRILKLSCPGPVLLDQNPSAWFPMRESCSFLICPYSSFPVGPNERTKLLSVFWGFPSGSAIENPPAMQEMQETLSLGQENPLEEEMAAHSRLLAWRIPCTLHGGGAWWATVHRAGHNWSRELDTTEAESWTQLQQLSTAQQTYFMTHLIF